MPALVQPHLNVLVAPQQGSQLALLREGAHHDHMVHGLAIHHNVGHPEVHVWGQPAIEFDLSVTVRSASGAIPEVQKVEMNGLVDLVDLVSEEEKNRYVCLRDAHWCGSSASVTPLLFVSGSFHVVGLGHESRMTEERRVWPAGSFVNGCRLVWSANDRMYRCERTSNRDKGNGRRDLRPYAVSPRSRSDPRIVTTDSVDTASDGSRRIACAGVEGLQTETNRLGHQWFDAKGDPRPRTTGTYVPSPRSLSEDDEVCRRERVWRKLAPLSVGGGNVYLFGDRWLRGRMSVLTSPPNYPSDLGCLSRPVRWHLLQSASDPA